MKKLFAVLLACTAMTAVFTGCGDKKSEKKDVDSKLVGEWHSDDLGGSLCFSDDKRVSISVEYTDYMYFDSDMNLNMSGMALDSEYDGSKLSVVLDEDDGADEEMELLTLERIGEADEDSLNGEYKLTGGELYSQLSTMFGEDYNQDINMTIDDEELFVSLDICDYKADGKKLEFTGDGVEFFDFDDEDEAICDYKIDGDNLTITESSGDTMELTKVE